MADPTSLSSLLAWFDPSDLSTLCQTSGGTAGDVGIGDPVGRIEDKSGNGYHATSSGSARPLLQQDGAGNYYLDFDGTDDSLITSSINATGSGKMTVWCGFTVDTNHSGTPLDFGAGSSVNGGFYLYHSSGTMRLALRGSALSDELAVADASFPNTHVFTLQMDFAAAAASQKRLRRDKVDSSGGSGVTGTNFGNTPLYIGQFASGLYLNGRFYGLIMRGAESTADEVAEFESFINQNTNAFPAIEQEGFRFYADGTESGAVALAAQDTDIVQPLATNVILRMLLNAIGDPATTQFRLDHKKSTDSTWSPVAALRAAQDAAWGAIGTAASGTTSATPSYPAGMDADQAVFLAITGRSNTADTAATSTGFSDVTGGTLEGGTGTWGVDLGTRRAQIMRKDTVTGSESGSITVSLAGTSANTLRASLFRIPVPTGYTLGVACASGADTTNATAYSATSGALDLQPGDLLVLVTAQNLDSGTATSRAVSATGITFGSITNRADTAVTNGNDHRHIINTVPVTAGTGNVAVTFSYTSSGNCSGPTVFMRLRLTAQPQPIILSGSANIAASGENTTARLTPPAGKTTGDFVAGRIADDENPLDTVNITADDYTEVAWVLQAQSPAANDDIYQFRVSGLDVYTVVPEWTIGDGEAEPITLDVEVGNLTLAGQSIHGEFSVEAAEGELTLTGQDITLSYTQDAILPVTAADLSLTGQSIGLHLSLAVTVANLGLTGQTIDPRLAITATSANLTLTGQDISLGIKVAVTPADLSLSGQDVGLLKEEHFSLGVDPADLTLAGQDISFTQSDHKSLSVDVGELTLTGSEVGMVEGTSLSITVEPANLVLAGQSIDLDWKLSVPMTPAGLVLQGQSVGMHLTLILGSGGVSLAGSAQTFALKLTVTPADIALEGKAIGLAWVDNARVVVEPVDIALSGLSIAMRLGGAEAYHALIETATRTADVVAHTMSARIKTDHRTAKVTKHEH